MRFFKWYQTRRRSGDGQCLPSAEIKRADCAQAFLRSAGGTRKTRGSQPERDNMAVGRWPSVNSDGTESEEAELTRNPARRYLDAWWASGKRKGRRLNRRPRTANRPDSFATFLRGHRRTVGPSSQALVPHALSASRARNMRRCRRRDAEAP